MNAAQLSFLDPAGTPEGLAYGPDFLSADEERALAGRIAGLPFKPFEFQGFLGKRETVSFGWSYRFDGFGLAEAAPIPDWLFSVRARAAAFAGLAPDALERALLIRYGEGAGLGWHRDRPVFDDGSASLWSRSGARSTCCAAPLEASGSTASRRSRPCAIRSR